MKLLLWLLFPVLAFAQPATGTLQVTFIDVGQADCILVRQGDDSLLIDAGNNDDLPLIEDYLQVQKVTRFVAVVATHAHEDHIGAMDSIVASFPIGKIWFPRQVTTTATYRNFILAVKAKGMVFQNPLPGVSFPLGAALCTFVGPIGDTKDDLNEGSAVLRIDFGSTSFLFTGDAGKEAEELMLNGSVPLQATVLKVGHHGSSGSTTASFLRAVKPQVAVISVGKDNRYGHPSKEVVNRLRKADVELFRTDQGTVTVVSDGKTVSVTPTYPSRGH